MLALTAEGVRGEVLLPHAWMRMSPHMDVRMKAFTYGICGSWPKRRKGFTCRRYATKVDAAGGVVWLLGPKNCSSGGAREYDYMCHRHMLAGPC